MYRDQYFKGQKVEYHGNNRIFFGEIVSMFRDNCISGGVRIDVLWNTGVQRRYFGGESFITSGKIKPVITLDKPKPSHKFSKNNPNRRFVENGKKI